MNYLLYGIEKTLIMDEIKKILKDNHIDNISITQYDLNIDLMENIIEDATTISLFQDKKVIICNNSYVFCSKKGKIEQKTDILEQYLKNKNPNTIIIFTLDNEKIDERKKITKLIDNTKSFNKVNNIYSYTKELFKDYSISDKTIQLFINKLNNNISFIKSESEKLKTYKFDEKVITDDDINLTITEIVDFDLFKLVDDIIKNNKASALKRLNEALKNGMEPIQIIITLANQFRLIYQTKELTKMGYKKNEIENELEQKEYTIIKAFEKAGLYSSDSLLDILNKLADLDYNIKCGNISKDDGLELFILGL